MYILVESFCTGTPRIIAPVQVQRNFVSETRCCISGQWLWLRWTRGFRSMGLPVWLTLSGKGHYFTGMDSLWGCVFKYPLFHLTFPFLSVKQSFFGICRFFPLHLC